jgi:hypothetical protein
MTYISLLSVVCYLLFFVGCIFKCYLLSDKGYMLYCLLSVIFYMSLEERRHTGLAEGRNPWRTTSSNGISYLSSDILICYLSFVGKRKTVPLRKANTLQ